MSNRIRLVGLSLALVVLASASTANAQGYYPGVGSCFGPYCSVSPIFNCVTTCVPCCNYKDQCVVYRWDPCTCCWVVDLVCDQGTEADMTTCAQTDVTRLNGLGVYAYYCCFKTKCNVYTYDWLHCNWTLKDVVDSCDKAKQEVQALLQTGVYATYCCYQDAKCSPVSPPTKKP